jgi:uncharacterized integral membrane protein (TIGR00697 family)
MKIKKLDLLISLYIAAICMAELMGSKIFQISNGINFLGNPLGTSVTVFLLPFIFSINDIIVEVHGKKRMLSVMRSGLVVVAFILIYSVIATILPTAERSWISADTYNEVFGRTIRVSFASLMAFAISIGLDILIFSRLREKLKKYGLWFRNIFSNILSQFLDSAIFMYIAYFALFTPNHNALWSVIIPYWIYRCILSVAIIPVVYWGVNWLKSDKE